MATIDVAPRSRVTEPSRQDTTSASGSLPPVFASVIPLLRFASAMAVLLAVAALPRSALFTVTDIAVAGTLEVPPGEIVARSGLHPGAYLFAIPAEQVTAAVTGHPRIASAQVRVSPSGRVVIHVVERTPQAALLYHGEFLLLDGTGVALEQRADPSGLPVTTVDGLTLPWIRLGDRLPSAEVARMLKALQKLPRGVAGQGTRMRMDSSGNLSLVTASGLTILLGELQGLQERAAIIPQLLEVVDRQHLAVQYVDLRFTGHVVLKPVGAAPEEGGGRP